MDGFVINSVEDLNKSEVKMLVFDVLDYEVREKDILSLYALPFRLPGNK